MDRTGQQCHNARVRFARLQIVLFGLVFALIGGQRTAAGDASTVRLPNGRSLTLELAATPQERNLGLMLRPSLAQDHGMLFLFPLPDRQGIWMKNMLIPIDILWLDDHKRIIHLESNVPPCRIEPCLIYQPPAPALYVIELAAGAALKADLKVGTTLVFEVHESAR